MTFIRDEFITDPLHAWLISLDMFEPVFKFELAAQLGIPPSRIVVKGVGFMGAAASVSPGSLLQWRAAFVSPRIVAIQAPVWVERDPESPPAANPQAAPAPHFDTVFDVWNFDKAQRIGFDARGVRRQ